MKFGFFDDANREYVITRPDTPLPWINYLRVVEDAAAPDWKTKVEKLQAAIARLSRR